MFKTNNTANEAVQKDLGVEVANLKEVEVSDIPCRKIANLNGVEVANLNDVQGSMSSMEELVSKLKAKGCEGITYQGSKGYLVPLMKAIENHCYNVFSTDTLLDLFTGGAALSAGTADCIKTIHMNDIGNITLSYFALNDIELLYKSLVYATQTVIYKLLGDKPFVKLDSNWNELDFSNVSREKIAEVFNFLRDDADCGFHRCRDEFRDGIDGFTEDDFCEGTYNTTERISATIAPGLMLIITYGSVNTAGVSVNYDRFIDFLEGIRDMYIFVEYSCDNASLPEALTRFFFTKEFENKFGRKPVNYQRLRKLFSTAAGFVGKEVTYSMCDADNVVRSYIEGDYQSLNDTNCLIVADPPYPSEEGNKYTDDKFNYVDNTVELMHDLDSTKTPYIVFCDENSIEVFEPAVHSRGLNVYSINPRRKNDEVVEYIITNIELPTGPYSTLPEDFKELAMANYKKALKNGLVFPNEVIESDEDFDKLGRRHLPLHKAESLPVDEEYRQQWAEIESRIRIHPFWKIIK